MASHQLCNAVFLLCIQSETILCCVFLHLSDPPYETVQVSVWSFCRGQSRCPLCVSDWASVCPAVCWHRCRAPSGGPVRSCITELIKLSSAPSPRALGPAPIPLGCFLTDTHKLLLLCIYCMLTCDFKCRCLAVIIIQIIYYWIKRKLVHIHFHN